MKFYVATRFADYERARALNEFVRAAGHTITHDWTDTDEFVNGKPVELGELTHQQMLKYANLDFVGVARADVVIFLGESDRCYGALIEVGIALAHSASVWVVAPHRDSVFFHLPEVKVFGSEQEMRNYLLGMSTAA